MADVVDAGLVHSHRDVLSVTEQSVIGVERAEGVQAKLGVALGPHGHARAVLEVDDVDVRGADHHGVTGAPRLGNTRGKALLEEHHRVPVISEALEKVDVPHDVVFHVLDGALGELGLDLALPGPVSLQELGLGEVAEPSTGAQLTEGVCERALTGVGRLRFVAWLEALDGSHRGGARDPPLGGRGTQAGVLTHGVAFRGSSWGRNRSDRGIDFLISGCVASRWSVRVRSSRCRACLVSTAPQTMHW